MSNADSPIRDDIVALMRANIKKIEKDVGAFLMRECEDLLAAGVDKAALAYGLMKLALLYGSQSAGSLATIEQLRKIADVFEESEARRLQSQVRH